MNDWDLCEVPACDMQTGRETLQSLMNKNPAPEKDIFTVVRRLSLAFFFFFSFDYHMY